MNAEYQALALLDIPVWLPRSAIAATTLDPRYLIFLAETKDQFSPEHHMQLTKILDFLNLKEDYHLHYQDSDYRFTEAQLVLSFGFKPTKIITSTYPLCTTFSISEMLSNPSCKRQVMNDIKPIKDARAADI